MKTPAGARLDGSDDPRIHIAKSTISFIWALMRPTPLDIPLDDKEFHVLARRGRPLPAGVCMLGAGHGESCDASGSQAAVVKAEGAKIGKIGAKRESSWLGRYGAGAQAIVKGIYKWFRTRRKHILGAFVAGVLLPSFWGRAMLICILIDFYYLEEERRKARKHVHQICDRCGYVNCHPMAGPFR